jgi:hypothetical protein
MRQFSGVVAMNNENVLLLIIMRNKYLNLKLCQGKVSAVVKSRFLKS